MKSKVESRAAKQRNKYELSMTVPYEKVLIMTLHISAEIVKCLTIIFFLKSNQYIESWMDHLSKCSFKALGLFYGTVSIQMGSYKSSISPDHPSVLERVESRTPVSDFFCC